MLRWSCSIIAVVHSIVDLINIEGSMFVVESSNQFGLTSINLRPESCELILVVAHVVRFTASHR